MDKPAQRHSEVFSRRRCLRGISRRHAIILRRHVVLACISASSRLLPFSRSVMRSMEPLMFMPRNWLKPWKMTVTEPIFGCRSAAFFEHPDRGRSFRRQGNGYVARGGAPLWSDAAVKISASRALNSGRRARTRARVKVSREMVANCSRPVRLLQLMLMPVKIATRACAARSRPPKARSCRRAAIMRPSSLVRPAGGTRPNTSRHCRRSASSPSKRMRSISAAIAASSRQAPGWAVVVSGSMAPGLAAPSIQ